MSVLTILIILTLTLFGSCELIKSFEGGSFFDNFDFEVHDWNHGTIDYHSRDDIFSIRWKSSNYVTKLQGPELLEMEWMHTSRLFKTTPRSFLKLIGRNRFNGLMK